MKIRLTMQLISPNEVPAFDNLFPTGFVGFGSFYDLPTFLENNTWHLKIDR